MCVTLVSTRVFYFAKNICAIKKHLYICANIYIMENTNKTWSVAIGVAIVAVILIGSTMFEHGHLEKSMYEKCMTKGYDCLD